MTMCLGNRTVAAIDAYLVRQEKFTPRRPYMGISYIGNPCDRYLWLMYRWADRRVADGRILRIFNRGNAEEIVMTNYLSMVGVELKYTSNPSLEDYGQLEVVDGSCKGHADGLIVRGLKEYPTEPMILEMKSMKKKLFDELEKKGCKATHIEHYTQQQCYTKLAREKLGLDLRRSCYMVTCKDDDRMYMEFIDYDEGFATRKLERANTIAIQSSIPKGISEDPTDFRCKMCSFYWFCHKKELMRNVNCRTCTYSTAMPDGTWICAKVNRPLSYERQMNGWACHIFLPDLQPGWKWHRKESNLEDFLFETENGGTFWNGKNSWLSIDIANGRKDGQLSLVDTFKGTVEHGDAT